MKLLVERGADVNRSDAVDIATLHRTSQQCSDELIQYLIDQEDQQHILRISNNDQELLDELMAIQDE